MLERMRMENTGSLGIMKTEWQGLDHQNQGTLSLSSVRISISNRTRGYKIEILTHVTSRRQNLRTKRLISYKCLTDRKWRVLEFSWTMGGWSEVVSYQPWEVLPEEWPGGDPDGGGLTKWAESSYLCVKGLILSAQKIFLHLNQTLFTSPAP